jgi:NarL family two-component system response regulator YdfI
LRALFDQEAEMEVVAETRDGCEVLNLIEKHLPDVALLDTSLPGTEIARVVEVVGERRWPTRIVALTPGLDLDDQLQEAISAGVSGCLLRRNTQRNAVRAVERVANGGIWFGHEIIRTMASCCEGRPQYLVGKVELTGREADVLQLLALGWTNRRIAHSLGVQERTVRFHLENIYRKLEVSSRTEASTWAVTNGLVDPRSPSSVRREAPRRRRGE